MAVHYFLPSELRSPEQVEAVLAAASDPVLAANLAARLDTMRRLAKPDADPFAGVVQADPSWDEAL
jgi:hypothetical protein